jgi:hypothetical protein
MACISGVLGLYVHMRGKEGEKDGIVFEAL